MTNEGNMWVRMHDLVTNISKIKHYYGSLIFYYQYLFKNKLY